MKGIKEREGEVRMQCPHTGRAISRAGILRELLLTEFLGLVLYSFLPHVTQVGEAEKQSFSTMLHMCVRVCSGVSDSLRPHRL